MAYFAGSFTVSTTGEFDITTIGFEPTWIRLSAGGKTGSNEDTNARKSTGGATDAFTWSDATLVNPNGEFSREYRNSNDRCLVVLATPGGTLTRVIDLQFEGFISNGVTLDAVAADGDYVIVIEAGN